MGVFPLQFRRGGVQKIYAKCARNQCFCTIFILNISFVHMELVLCVHGSSIVGKWTGHDWSVGKCLYKCRENICVQKISRKL